MLFQEQTVWKLPEGGHLCHRVTPKGPGQPRQGQEVPAGIGHQGWVPTLALQPLQPLQASSPREAVGLPISRLDIFSQLALSSEMGKP